MTHASTRSGYFRYGLPHDRAGRGPEPLVIFPGLTFENKPQIGTLSMYSFLRSDYTLFSVYRRPRMPEGYTLRDMANDDATMVREEFGGPVDVIGVSTGGSIALHFAADHRDLVVTVLAEDRHEFRERPAEIPAPALVAGGTDDFFYSPALFRETAAGIPRARLGLCGGMGHPARGRRFREDVRAFRREAS